MRLPQQIESEILSRTGLEGLNFRTQSRYTRKLKRVREEMRRLTADFFVNNPSEAKYSDAYFLYNFPTNVMKTMFVAEEIRKHWSQFLLNRNHYSVLDVGCGDGAGMIGLYHALKDRVPDVEFRLMGIDSSKIMLDRARQMLQFRSRGDPRLKARLFQRNAREVCSATSRKKYDIILLVNSLAEIVEDDTLPSDFMGRLYGSLVEGGLLVIIEPALKKLTRRLMYLRDDLTRHKRIQVILPCLHDGPCALLNVKGRDEWCHQSVAWSPPEYLRVINQGLNREIGLLKFSYLVAVRTKVPLSATAGYRVVSNLLREKGRSRCYLCSPRGRVELVRLNKNENQCNRDFGETARGSILRIENAASVKPLYWQISDRTTVELID
ncbi:MAG: methyltransferase domain-containing protein [candidate division WOR-3 bacterium]|nr:MAG: methyltransferase domain-containing protein [candidate division WOR-3 bacterium]